MDSNNTNQPAAVAWFLTTFELGCDSNSSSDRVVAVSLTKQGLLSTVKSELDAAVKSDYCRLSKEQNRRYRTALESNDVDVIVETWNTMRCHTYGLSLDVSPCPLVG